ncbi:serine protease FAM111A-like [Antechinus flavipes]|uniref:serine protease FAM111A-like n=1 Tax=Antechinus flavipes TaxID=38775 RepID=UPI0022362EE9|nr:serine protease FAM111A-like [Antechinus flavipes]
MESGGDKKVLQPTSNDERNMSMSNMVKQEQLLPYTGKEELGNNTSLSSEDGKCNEPIATADVTDDTEVEFSIKIRQKNKKSEDKYMVFGKPNDSVYKMIIKNEIVENELKKRPKEEMRVSIDETREDGTFTIYLNLGMPLKCLPENSHLHITFFNSNEDQDDLQKYNKTIGQKCFTFYISVTGMEIKKIIKPKYDAPKYDYLLVFGTGGDTVGDALRNDGRFLPWVTGDSWTLVKDETNYPNTYPMEKVANQKFKVCVHKNKKTIAHENGSEKKTTTTKKCKQKPHSKEQPDHLDTTQEGAQSPSADDKFLKPEMLKEDRKRIPAGSKPEQSQFYILKEYIFKTYTFFTRENNLISHFFQTEEEKVREQDIGLFNLHQEKYGKVTEDATTSKNFKTLATLLDSIGYICVNYNGQSVSGTCFVFWDRYILTCRHVLDLIITQVEEPNWAQAISENSFVTFTDENPSESPKRYTIEAWFEVSSIPLDYAVLQLKGNEIPKGLFKQKQNTETPHDGTVFIIGHPEGWLKKIDICMVIPLAERENTYQTVLQDRKKPECNPTNCPENKTKCVHMFSPKSFREHKVMDSEDFLTYHTSFFSGSSGSPVLDASGRLVALHAAGFSYTYQQQQQSIIEYGYSINSIHEDMVHNHGSWYNLLFPYPQDVEMESCDDSPQGFCLQGRCL